MTMENEPVLESGADFMHSRIPVSDVFSANSPENIEEEAPAADVDIRHCQKIIEAVLFAAGYPVSYERLAVVLGTTPGAAKRIVKDYAEDYNNDVNGLPRGIMILIFEASCQLCTREQYGTYIREALGIRRGGNLSQSSIESLAVIAYNEPVTKAFVETVRGVDCSYTITSLCEKKLIASCGRLDVPGRPILYRTTDDFLRVFGISSLSDLPAVSVSAGGIQEKMVFCEETDDKIALSPEDLTSDEGEYE